MALQKQVVRMSAQGGLDTKTDEKNVLPTNFLELENVRFTKTNSFSKRYGYLAYPDSILESTERITNGQAATTFKNELLCYSDTTLYSYSASEEKWASKGVTSFAIGTTESIATNGDRLIQPNHSSYSGLTCYVWERTTLNSSAPSEIVEYRFVDEETGAVVYTGEIENATLPQVVAVSGRYFIFYHDSGAIHYRVINFSTPSEISAATSVLTVPTPNYITDKIGNRAYVAAPGATGLLATYITTSGSVATPITIADAGTYAYISIAAEQTNSVRFVYGQSSTGSVKTILYGADLNVVLHSAVTLASSVQCTYVGSVQDPSDVDKSQIYYQLNTSAPYLLKRAVVTSSGTTESNATLMYQAKLQSRPQAINGIVHFAICKDSTFLTSGPPFSPYRTIYLANEEGELISKFCEDSAVIGIVGGLPKLVLNGEKLEFCVAEIAEIQTNLSTGTVLVPTVIRKLVSDFSSLNNHFDATLGDNLHIAGGIMKMYDGATVVEHGFLETPATPVLDSESTLGAVLPDGTYQYVAVYAWIDKWGQIHRSRPSLPLSYEVTGGPKLPTISVQTLAFTKKDDVEIEIYRTEANGTTFYKWSYSYLDRIKNNKTVESIDFSDTTADAELLASERAEFLYTEGGILENSSADSCKFTSTYKGRLMNLLSDGYTIQYSKKREQNGPVEFASELKITLDEAGGPGTCTAALDDNFIIFKERAIFAMSGEGPNALGEQDDFRQPQLITSDCGCVDPNSVVATPEGLMFKSSKGIQILTRGLQVIYIGAPVEAYNDSTITSATLLSSTNEVRFTTNSDKLLMYDYQHKFWSTHTNINAVDATVYDGQYVYLRENGQLMRETPDLYSDNGSYIKMKLVSAWVQLAGIQGVQRLYKLLLLGSFKSAHSLKVKFAYDFNPAWLHEATVNAGALLSNPSYGEDDTYGDSDVYGGEFPLYQFDVRPKIQRCEAFKFSIEDFKTDGNGEAFSLSNMAVEIGVKPTITTKGRTVAAS
jgi:hypothetical protein